MNVDGGGFTWQDYIMLGCTEKALSFGASAVLTLI